MADAAGVKVRCGIPSVFVPTLYFAEGLPYTIVNLMSVVFFKTLGASNEFIGLTSILYLPWTVKLLWAPLVDFWSTRRQWIVVSQLVLAALSAFVAASCLSDHVLALSLVLFAAMAFASATHDIAIDGYYLDVLSPAQQSFFVGVRNAAYKVAWLAGSGGLVYLAGAAARTVGVASGWCLAFAVCAGLFAFLCLFHKTCLPEPGGAGGQQAGAGLTLASFLRVFRTYFQQARIGAVVVYILIFRLGDALMLKMAQPFLIDPPNKGGLGLTVADVGLVYGTVGTLFLLAGGLCGGWLVSRHGLGRCLLPTAIVQNSAILLYWLLALARPGLPWVALCNSLEQFAYGLGVSAYTVFLIRTVKDEYRAAHYAIATALMALGVMLPGAASGYLVSALGYQSFFLLSFFLSLPGLAVIFLLPLRD